ncbi:MAG: hypothetical protein VB131_08155 [Burkholderia gladioli]
MLRSWMTAGSAQFSVSPVEDPGLGFDDSIGCFSFMIGCRGRQPVFKTSQVSGRIEHGAQRQRSELPVMFRQDYCASLGRRFIQQPHVRLDAPVKCSTQVAFDGAHRIQRQRLAAVEMMGQRKRLYKQLQIIRRAVPLFQCR